MAPGLASFESIDWTRPWFAPWRALGQPLASRIGAGVSVAQALNSVPGAPVRFVPQTALPRGMAYEAFIRATAQVPTREGLHDFFNGLVWLQFPLAKRQLNALQAGQLARDGVQARRGRTRDALTILDENAALMVAPQHLWQALQAKEWTSVFRVHRDCWAQVTLVLFGHALLEKLVFPRKGITAHVLLVQAASNSLADLDAWLAQALESPHTEARALAHLPVLGVPGWWEGNHAPSFYEDTSVFRSPRSPASP